MAHRATSNDGSSASDVASEQRLRPEPAAFVPSQLSAAEIQKDAEHRHLTFVDSNNPLYGGHYVFNIDHFCQQNSIEFTQQQRIPELREITFAACLFISSDSRQFILLPCERQSDLRSFYIATQIAHIFLHLPGDVPHRNGSVFSRNRIPAACVDQAVQFAEALLLPRKLLPKRPNESEFETYIERIAVMRDVARQVVRDRIVKLSLV
jgi:hypothetical protein